MDPFPSITFSCTTDGYSVDEDKIIATTARIGSCLGLDEFEISVSIVSVEDMQALNQQHRGIDRSTDVLSFPQQEFSEKPQVKNNPSAAKSSSKRLAKEPPALLGDIVISPADAERNAREIGQSLDREVCFLLVHGMLHLCGYDHIDRDDAEEMTAAERSLMSILETEPESPAWMGCVKHAAGDCNV